MGEGQEEEGRAGGGRGKMGITVGVLEGEVVADEPAAGGPEDDYVATGGHGSDDAVAPRSVALQGVDGEQLAGAASVHGWCLVGVNAYLDSGRWMSVGRRCGSSHWRGGRSSLRRQGRAVTGIQIAAACCRRVRASMMGKDRC